MVCALLVVFASLWQGFSTDVYADDIADASVQNLFMLFNYMPGNYLTAGFTSKNYGVPVPYENSVSFANITLNNFTWQAKAEHSVSFMTSPWSKGANPVGKTIYITYFLECKGGPLNRNTQNIGNRNVNGYYTTRWDGSFPNLSNMVDNYPMDSTYVKPFTVNMLGDNGTNSYHAGGYNETPITGFYFTIPENARAIWAGAKKPYTVSADATDIRIVFPCLEVADWGADIADTMGDVLAELQTQTGQLNTAIQTLNKIYNQLVGIHADTTTIKQVLQATAPHIENIDTNVQGIYDILHEALKSEGEELSRESQQAIENVMQREDAEQYWMDSNTDNFNAIGLENFSFSSGVVSGFRVVGNYFERLWEVLGDATLFITFPLIFGIALIVIGRASASAAKGSKKKGGDDG